MPSVVRVSAARPAPVRAPVPRGTRSPAVPSPSSSARPAAAAGQVSEPVDGRLDARLDGPADVAADAPAGTALLLADGRRVPLTTTLLVGRDPAPRAGEAVGALVAVDDPARSVSKTHLAVGTDAVGAWVVDRHSTNGTVVTLPDGQRILCVPERRVRLVAGAAVHFGDHGFTLSVADDGQPPR
jgi:FHA domain